MPIASRSSFRPLVVLLVAAACSRPAPVGREAAAPAPDTVVAAPRADTLEIALGQARPADGGRITVAFLERLDDSRCPADVTCVWAGDATVRLGLRTEGSDGTATLRLRREPVSAVAGAYTVRVLDLRPYPVSGEPPAPQPVPTVVVEVARR